MTTRWRFRPIGWPDRVVLSCGRHTSGTTTLTTVKASFSTRQELKALADRDNLTLDATLQKLLRAERRRQVGRDLAERPVSGEDRAWVSSTSAAVARAVG
jgi:hypothetical protein